MKYLRSERGLKIPWIVSQSTFGEILSMSFNFLTHNHMKYKQLYFIYVNFKTGPGVKCSGAVIFHWILILR